MKTEYYAPVKNDKFLLNTVRKDDLPTWTTNPEEAKRYHDRRQAVHFARSNKFGITEFKIIVVTTEIKAGHRVVIE